MSGPRILANVPEGLSLPEIDGRYLIQQKIMVPNVWISDTLLVRLIIPIKRAQRRIHVVHVDTMDVKAADEAMVVGDTVGLQYVLHTIETMQVPDVVKHVSEHTGIRIASRERRPMVHTPLVLHVVIR